MSQAMKDYYDPQKRMGAHFMNLSLNTPLIHDNADTHFGDQMFIPKFPARHAHRHLPWNHQLEWENMAMMYLNRAKLDTNFTLPPMYVINLEHRKDRMFEFQFLNKFSIFNPQRLNAVKTKPGFVGCALSHLCAINKAKQNGDEMCIVVEDDMMFTIENWEKRLLQVISWLRLHPEEWEVFNSIPIGQNVDQIDKVLNRELGIVRTVGGLNTQFVIYHSSCYDKLLKLVPLYTATALGRAQEMYLAWDELLSRNCKMASCIPLFTNAYSYDSDITKNNIAYEQPMRNFYSILKWYDNNLHHFVGEVFDDDSDVTVCMTSCNRYPELVLTLDSLLKNLSHPVKEIIISEENYDNIVDRFNERYPNKNIRMIRGKGNHMDSLDNLYKDVSTTYVFHMEEDWTCTRPFFIEQSKMIMQSDPNVLQVWLRDINDTNKHPVGDYKRTGKLHAWKMDYNYADNWHGFSFNPGLKRTDQLVKFADFRDGKHNLPEENVSEYYKDLGMYAMILPVGCFYHTGYATTYSSIWRTMQGVLLDSSSPEEPQQDNTDNTVIYHEPLPDETCVW